MNYTSDYLIDKVFLSSDSSLNMYEKENIIEDVLLLQKKAHPLGILKDTSFEVLITLDDKSLVMIHRWQNEMFAMKHFKECGRNPPK